MANYGDAAPGPIIGGARRKPRAMWRKRFSVSSDEDASRIPALEDESPRRGRRRVVSVVRRRSASQTTIEDGDGQGDYGEDYIDPEVLQSYYAVQRAEQEEDADSSLGILDQRPRGRRSASPQHPLGVRPGEENLLEMARGVMRADMSPVPLQVPAPEYLFPGTAAGGGFVAEDPFQMPAVDPGRPPTPPVSDAATIVKQSLSRLKQKIEDMTNMRVQSRPIPSTPQSAGKLLQQIQQEAQVKYQEEQKQYLKQERIRRRKKRILQKTLQQAIRRAAQQYHKVQQPGADRRAGISVREGELMEFSPTEVERHVQDFGGDAADLQPIGDNLMSFSPSPKRVKEVPQVGIFLDAPRLVAVPKRLDFSGNEGLSPEEQDFWWRSPEVKAFRRVVPPPVVPPSPPKMDLVTGEALLTPARRSPRRYPGTRIQELEAHQDDIWLHSVSVPPLATPPLEPVVDVEDYESPDLVEMSQRLARIREIPSDVAPEEPVLEAMGFPGSEYVMEQRRQRLRNRILDEYRRLREQAGEPILEDQVVQAATPVLKQFVEGARVRLRDLEGQAREERIHERRRRIIEKARDFGARRAMERHNRRRRRERRRRQEGSLLDISDAGHLRIPSPEPLMLHSPDLLVQEFKPKDFGLQPPAEGDLLQFSPDPEQVRLREERERLRREKRAKRRERWERRMREEEEERRRLEVAASGVHPMDVPDLVQFSPAREEAAPEIRLVAELPPEVQLVAELPADVPVVDGRISPGVQLVAELPPEVQLVAELPREDAGQILEALSPPKVRAPPKRLLEGSKKRQAALEEAKRAREAAKAAGEAPPPKAGVKKPRKKPAAAPPPPVDEPEMTEEELMALFKPKKAAMGVSPPGGQPRQVMTSPVRGSPVRGSPVRGSPVRGSPVRGSPVRGSPVRGSPVRGSPKRAAAPPPPAEPELTEEELLALFKPKKPAMGFSPPGGQPAMAPAVAAVAASPVAAVAASPVAAVAASPVARPSSKRRPVRKKPASAPPPAPVAEPELTEEELLALFKPKKPAVGFSPPGGQPAQVMTSPVRRSPVRGSPVRRSPVRGSPVRGSPEQVHYVGTPRRGRSPVQLAGDVLIGFSPPKEPLVGYDLPVQEADVAELVSLESVSDVSSYVQEFDPLRGPPAEVVDRNALYTMLSREDNVGAIGPANREWSPPVSIALYDIRNIPIGDWVPPPPPRVPEDIQEQLVELVEDLAAEQRILRGEALSGDRFSTPRGKTPPLDSSGEFAREPWVYQTPPESPEGSYSGDIRGYYTPPLIYDYAYGARPRQLLEMTPPKLLTPPLAAPRVGAGAPLIKDTSDFGSASSSEYFEPEYESEYVQSQLAFGSPQRNPLLREMVSTSAQSPLYERAWKKVSDFFD